MDCFSKLKNNLLIYGSSGWIGSLFINLLKERDIKFVCGKARVDSITDILCEIKIYKPTHIIAFIGRTHGKIDDTKINTIDYLEHPGKLKENIRDNLFAPLTLSAICSKKNIHYTYIGTGCIFNSPDKVYTEFSEPDFFGSSYSIVKGFTDRLIKNFPVLNIRIRMPISSVPNERNFINKITSYSKICSISNSMTILDDYLPIILDLALNKKIGTYNCTNPGTISHNEILTMYREIVDPTFKWENMTLKEQAGVIKSERSNNKLDTTKIHCRYTKLPDIHESVRNILIKFKKNV